MNKEERTELVFETLSKLIDFEIKPEKEFYVIIDGIKDKYKMDENLNLYYITPPGSVRPSEYNILAFFNNGYQFEEIKKPLLTEEEKDFLRHFKFKELLKEEISKSTLLHMYDENDVLVATINLHGINFNFNGLKENKKYFKAEFWL